MSFDPGFLTERVRQARDEHKERDEYSSRFTKVNNETAGFYRVKNGEIQHSVIDLDKHDHKNIIPLDYDSVERRYTFEGTKDVKKWIDEFEKNSCN
jgi:hypothetical protein